MMYRGPAPSILLFGCVFYNILVIITFVIATHDVDVIGGTFDIYSTPGSTIYTRSTPSDCGRNNKEEYKENSER